MSTHSNLSTPREVSLPEVILDYISAVNGGNVDVAAAFFSEDATVHDENLKHSGRDAIRGWIDQTTRDYAPHNEILGATFNGDSHEVISKVSGNFPGSPAELQFSFVIANEKISQLAIQ